MDGTARKRTIYQDPYNPIKTWEVTELSGGYYLKQFIKGKQFGRGSRTTKKHLKEMGIFEMECIKVIDNWKEGNGTMNIKERESQAIVEALEVAKKAGYRSFMPKDENCAYGYMVSKENVLYIQRTWGMYHINVEYIPCRKYGNGWKCCEVGTVTVEIIKEAEQKGANIIAWEGIKKYRDPMSFITNNWQELIEL